MEKSPVSAAVIRRLPRYLRYLGELLLRDVERISSQELSRLMGLTASQVRQDFNCFGGYGQQGYGYNVAFLHREIASILGIEEQQDAILVGAGNLGRALINHISFERRGFHLVDIYDRDPKLVGSSLHGHTVHHIDLLEEHCARHLPSIAILTVPRLAAGEVVTRLVACGVKGFWNFSSLDIRLPDVTVENVRLGDSLMTLRYRMKQRD